MAAPGSGAEVDEVIEAAATLRALTHRRCARSLLVLLSSSRCRPCSTAAQRLDESWSRLRARRAHAHATSSRDCCLENRAAAQCCHVARRCVVVSTRALSCMSTIEFKRLDFRHGALPILKDIDVSFAADGELAAALDPTTVGSVYGVQTDWLDASARRTPKIVHGRSVS